MRTSREALVLGDEERGMDEQRTSIFPRLPGGERSSREARVTAGGDVGAYRIARPLVHAPGAWLFEAREQASGERMLLQIARLQGVRSKAELNEREYFERRVAAATALLLADPTISILAHAALDEAGGGRILYWALPWAEGLEHLAAGSVSPRTGAKLVELAARGPGEA